MRSIEAALARDFANRGAAIIPLVFLAMVALPLWIFENLGRDVLRSTSKEGVVLHVTLTLAMGFFAAVAVFQAQGKLTRFFVRPISAARLVACQMTLGMATIALMYLGSAGLLNLGGAGWPLLGPALFLATTLACVLAAIWSFEGTVVGQFAACVATCAPLVIWFNRCYGATIMGDWHVMWRSPSAEETLTLGGIGAAAYGLAIVGVTRTRRGDLWDFAAIKVWWERQWTRGSAPSPFSGPMRAQLWSEWREKLGPAPACLLAIMMLAAFGSWIAGHMATKAMLEFMLGLPILLLVLVMPLVFGLVVGNYGKEGKWGMKHVQATRPVTDGFLAHALLRNCATALFWAWVTWIVGLIAIGSLVYLSGHREEVVRVLIPPSFDQWNVVLPFVLIPLMSWTLTALMATLAATGRPWLWTVVLFGVFGLVLLFFLMKGFVSPPMFDLLVTAGLVLSGGLYLGGTAWAFVVAFQRRLISAVIVLRAVAGWVVMSIMAALAWPESFLSTGVLLWHGLGFLALAILPFAAMPLAIRWNRHR
jgi:hypothetical protein